jgi:hypothetical protein
MEAGTGITGLNRLNSRKNPGFRESGDSMVRMTGQRAGLILVLLFLIITSVSGADSGSSQSQPNVVDPQKLNLLAASYVQVSNISLDPPMLMPGDTAMVTLVLENTMTSSASSPVIISAAEMRSDDLNVLTRKFDKVGTINPGTRVPLTFSLKAGSQEGIFYPVFSASFQGAHSLRYPFPVIIDSSPVDLSLSDAPDTWIAGKKGTVTLNVANMRSNEVNRVEVAPQKAGFYEVLPESSLIGSIGPNSAIPVPFTITPQGSGQVNFSVRYYNGENIHAASCTIPLTIGTSKQQANVTVTRTDLTADQDHILLKGDVYNSGLQAANAVIVSVKEPAVPVYPYKQYGVGILKPSDFAGFQITFIPEKGMKSVTLITTSKDSDGRIQSDEIPVDITGIA